MEFKKFVFGETLEQALDALPDEMQLRFYRMIKNYGLHGIEPELTGVELAVWVQMKAMIDITIPKRHNASPVGKIGAPYGNKNAQKTNENNSENNQNNSGELNSENNSENNKQLSPNANDNANDNGNENENDNANENPQSLFLYYWQHNPDIFDFQARIEKWKDWEKFWKESHVTCSQIKTAMDNFILDVREGIIERKYIPLLPDRFVLNGWLTKCQERQKPPSSGPPRHHIANDNISAEDLDQYFS